MKKISCYSKYDYLLYLLMAILVIGVGCLVLKISNDEEDLIYKIFWIIIISFGLLFSCYKFFYNQQYIYVDKQKIILKNAFFKINELEIQDCFFEIVSLPTHLGRNVIKETWICIYSNKANVKKFKYGTSNSRKYKRIQLKYTPTNLEIIKKIFET